MKPYLVQGRRGEQIHPYRRPSFLRYSNHWVKRKDCCKKSESSCPAVQYRQNCARSVSENGVRWPVCGLSAPSPAAPIRDAVLCAGLPVIYARNGKVSISRIRYVFRHGTAVLLRNWPKSVCRFGGWASLRLHVCLY